MITLKADNRDLTLNAKFSYLSDNFLSGVSSITVTNSDGFATDDYVLVGEFGSETSEILKIQSVTTATHTITFTTVTKWSHAESSKVAVIKYNQVRFFHTADTTFSAGDPVTGYIDIQPDTVLTLGYDTTNTTGYGWFIFYNSTTLKATQTSNAIPYAGFAANSVKAILDNFFSILNNKELKLISEEDAFSWLNEAYSIAQNELNLSNKTFSTTLDYTVTTTAGLAEYSFPSNFSKLISVYNNEGGTPVSFIELQDVTEYNSNTGNTIKYYVRGDYLGISPTPTSAKVFKITHTTKTGTLDSYYDNVELPNDNFYCLKDYMMFRASPKLNRGDGSAFYKLFEEAIKRLKVTSIKQDANNDSWDIDPCANV